MSPVAVQEVPASEFDAVACNYEETLQRGLHLSGESAAYFAASRAAWTRKRLNRFNISKSLHLGIDFGCGTGNSIPHLQHTLGCRAVVGLDPSIQSLQVARASHPASTFQFYTLDAYRPRGDADLVFCNGVFHHIPPNERTRAIETITSLLRPGGVFAYWENNCWNPGTRFLMKRIPFDRDAVPISIPQSRRLLEQAKLQVICVDTCFYFPRVLKWLRGFEPYLCKFPLGAQYLCLAMKPR